MGMCGTIRDLRAFIWNKFTYFPTSSRGYDEGNIHQERFYILNQADLEHRELNDLKTIVEIVDWLDERFILRREDEDGYGEAVLIDENRRMTDE
jgi:hypothetical protein